MEEYRNNNDDDSLIFILDNGVKFSPKKRCISDNTGVIINLSENSYRFLTLLLKGEMDKQNIINQVWYEQRGSVSDSSYYGQIYSLRKTLETFGISSSVIKTLPRRGVKYMGKVEMMHDISEDCAVPSLDEEDMATTEPPGKIHSNSESIKETSRGEEYEGNTKSSGPAWMNSRRWNILITIMAIIAVCWLSTLAVAIFMFLL